LQAGADSIFYGDLLLTTGNPDVEADRQLLADAGVQANWQNNARTLVNPTPASI
jgi:biotin synthase